MIAFRASVDGVQGARYEIRRFGEGVRDLGPWLAEEEQEFYRREGQLFRTENAGKWPELSSAYARYKARVRPGRPMMVFDGDLREGLTRQGGSGQVRIVEKTRLVLGTDRPYAHFHHRGRGMPLRQLIVMDQETERGMVRRLHRYLAALWTGPFFQIAGARR